MPVGKNLTYMEAMLTLCNSVSDLMHAHFPASASANDKLCGVNPVHFVLWRGYSKSAALGNGMSF